jgi:hypothetical protein
MKTVRVVKVMYSAGGVVNPKIMVKDVEVDDYATYPEVFEIAGMDANSITMSVTHFDPDTGNYYGVNVATMCPDNGWTIMVVDKGLILKLPEPVPAETDTPSVNVTPPDREAYEILISEGDDGLRD